MNHREADCFVARRIAIILACAQSGSTNSSVARKLGVSRPTVILWRNRFAQDRLRAIYDAG